MNSKVSEGETTSAHDYDHASFAIGLSLAISSSVFIGASFIIKKIALRRLNAPGAVRASAGGFAYLKQWLWWLGLVTMGLGEAANLVAYAFAPAALVTPLGALSVLVAAVLASRFLNEHLNLIGKLGCALCVLGSIVIVIHSPKADENATFRELLTKLTDAVFLAYAAVVLLVTLAAKLFLVPKHGNTNVAVYLLMCSAVGSLTVVFCKAVALAARESLANLSHYAFWPLLLAAVGCVAVQMNYLNRSLDAFNTGVVTPVYYVMFTVLVIVATGLLFREWRHMGYEDALGCGAGFLVVVVAVFMLNAFRDVAVSLKSLNLSARRRRDPARADYLAAPDARHERAS